MKKFYGSYVLKNDKTNKARSFDSTYEFIYSE